MYGNDFVIFPEEFHSDEVYQGRIGDCYFVTCLAALAAKPDRIKKLFKTVTPNAAGCYVMNLCVNGSWQEVVVDDYLPADEDSTGASKPRFGGAAPQGGKAVVWVSLIEKAWAKICGNYERIIMGTVDMGFIHLCGVPSVGFKHLEYKARRDDLWSALSVAQKRGHIMTAGTADDSKAMEELLDTGLVANHCYSILSIHEVTSQGKKVRLLKLKNPFGGGAEWHGVWSSNSELWTPALRTQVGDTADVPGVFCIPLEDYIARCSFTNICKYEDDDCHSYIFKNKPVPAKSYFEFELGKDFKFG